MQIRLFKTKRPFFFFFPKKSRGTHRRLECCWLPLQSNWRRSLMKVEWKRCPASRTWSLHRESHQRGCASTHTSVHIQGEENEEKKEKKKKKRKRTTPHLNQQVDGGNVWLDVLLEHLAEHLQGKRDLQWKGVKVRQKQKQKTKTTNTTNTTKKGGETNLVFGHQSLNEVVVRPHVGFDVILLH